MTTKQENKFYNLLKSIKLQKMVICFMLYAVFGWCYEVFLEVVIYRWGFSDRGVLFGPYCPVYGVGATVFVLSLYKYKKESDKNIFLKIVTVFLGCMLMATLLELVTSYILELFTGAWPWQTYKDYAINFQGRIAVSPSVRFGLGGLIFLYIFQPFFDMVLEKLKDKQITVISIVVLVVLMVDFVCTMVI